MIEIMKKPMVVTFNNEEHPREQCRLISGKWYKEGNANIENSGQCYQINGTWYRVTTSGVFYNHTNKKYEYDPEFKNVVRGVVAIDKKGELQLGYFSITENFPRRTDGGYYIMEGVIIGPYYIEDYSTGLVVYANNARATAVPGKHYQYQTFDTAVYSAAHNPMVKEVEKTVSKVNFPVSQLDEYINHTVGIEFESQAGCILERDLYRLGLIPLKDGSIEGYEYVTTVIKNNYFGRLKAICDEFKNRKFIIDTNNSLHIHFGNIPANTDREYYVAFYELYRRVQDTLENIVPPYKRSLEYFKSKKGGIKDHCRLMPDLGTRFPAYINATDKNLVKAHIDEAFGRIWQLYAGARPNSNFNLNNMQHPFAQRPKWEQLGRYYSVNLIGALFSNQSPNTIEFRLHHGTLNFHKIGYWMLICNALINYANIKRLDILSSKVKIDLSDVISEIYDAELAMVIMAYVDHASKQHTQTMLDGQLFDKDFSHDASFNFRYDGKGLDKWIQEEKVTASSAT